MARYKTVEFQLHDLHTDAPIMTAGGVAFIMKPGTPDKATLYNPAFGSEYASLANPISLNRGKVRFAVDSDVIASCDIAILAPGGQFVFLSGVGFEAATKVRVDQQRLQHCMKIPFSIADTTATTETDTGFDEPTGALMLPTPFIDVTTTDATETIDVGTDSGDSGDADGFLAAVSVANSGVVKGTVANGANTMGALFEVQDSANAGDVAPEGRVSAGKSITYTLTAGTDTAKGFIYLPYILSP